MKHRALPIVVATGLSLSCGDPAPAAETTADVEPISANPPAWPTRPASEPLTERVSVSDHSRYPRDLNPVLPPFGTVFASDGGGCLTFPTDGQMRPPGMMPPPKEVECPPALLDPAWNNCTGVSYLSADASGEHCACSPMGNPPPPAFEVPCPAGIGAKAPLGG